MSGEPGAGQISLPRVWIPSVGGGGLEVRAEWKVEVGGDLCPQTA